MITNSRALKLVAAVAVVAGFSFTPFRDMASLPVALPSVFAATADSCGYSGTSTTATAPRSTLLFNENSAARGAGVTLTSDQSAVKTINLYYSDEHALTLGQSPGVTPFVAEYNSTNGTTGTLISGDAGTGTNGVPPTVSVGVATAADPFGRPIYPALFLTDLTANGAGSKAGDWQSQSDGNTTAIAPNAVLGTWKPFTPGVTVNDPASNKALLGPFADYPFKFNLNSTAIENYGAEVRWDVATMIDPATGQALIPGHTYRAQFMAHDGDQNKTGGDVGEGCQNFTIPLNPTITITPPAAINDVQTTTSHDFTANVTVNGNPAPDGTVVSWSIKSGPGTLSSGTCTTTGGSCTITLSEATPTTGLTELQACTPTVSGGSPGGVIGSKCTSTASPGTTGNDALKEWVDAQLLLTPRNAVNVVNNAHTITATVKQDDGLAANTGGGDATTGFGPAPDGTTVTFSFTQNASGATFVGGVNTCTTTNGSCSIQINSASVGTDQVHATTTFTITGTAGLSISVTRSTGAFDPSSNLTDAQKIYINPKTTLTVKDTLTGLDSGAQGTVTYQAGTACTGGVLGGTITALGVQTVTNGVAPQSTLSIDVTPGTTLYFNAIFTAGQGSSEGSSTTPCSAESATSN